MGRIDPRQGGSMIYVIMLMTMFAIMSTGFLYMSNYSLEAVLHNHEYMEAQTTAKLVHQSYCQDVSAASSEAMNRIWEIFEGDCLALVERRSGAELAEALKRLEYRAEGRGESGDLTVEISLTARPAKGEATVNTRVTRHGYTFSLGADIRFDDADGETLIIPLPEEEPPDSDEPEADEGAEPGEDGEERPETGSPDDPEGGTPDCLRFNMQGNGVYRYYEGAGSQ